MRYEIVELKKEFPELGAISGDPFLTAYLPLNMSEMGRHDNLRPCMLILPGGGYAMVSQREGEPIAMHLLAAGYNVFVLTYSVAPARYPTQLLEVAAALELINRKALVWNTDINRIGIMGFSAGGHLAAHYCNAYKFPAVRNVFPNSIPVKAAVLGYPVITTDHHYCHEGSFENLLGHFPEEDELLWFSCEKLVTCHTPPTFIWHTAEDPVVPVENSLLYAKSLAYYNVPFALHIYPYGSHGLSTVDRQTNDFIPENMKNAKNWIPEMIDWLDREFHNA